MPLNKQGKHYANPAYGRMMEGGKSMASYGDKAAAYLKDGYMINRMEIEYAENGFVVKCHWEKPKKLKGSMEVSYMEPTVKVFKTVGEVQSFVKEAFNEMHHLSYPGENGRKPKAPLRNRNKGVKGSSHSSHNPGHHSY